MTADPAPPRSPVRPVEVDRTSPVPLYFQVASRLQELIENGEIGVGARIENEVDLAERLGVSRPTTRRAIQYLVERGMLVRKRGVGTQVVARDFTGDKKPDIVVGNKKGTFVLIQETRKVTRAEWDKAQPKPSSTATAGRATQ